jgi:hypothetical protein
LGYSGRSYQLKQMETGLYKHYKGKIYEVIGVAHHSETLEELVVYKATYQTEGENLWVRPIAMFNETISQNGESVKRFLKIEAM